MKEFLSLKEFMLLDEYPGKEFSREFYKHMTGREWVNLYNIAKSSWLRYGDDGPPLNCQVECLFSGHGGGAGVIRTFIGPHKTEQKFFALSRQDEWHGFEEISLVYKETWWREIRQLESIEVILQRALEIIPFENIVKQFPHFNLKKDMNFLHPFREDELLSWLRENGVLC